MLVHLGTAETESLKNIGYGCTAATAPAVTTVFTLSKIFDHLLSLRVLFINLLFLLIAAAGCSQRSRWGGGGEGGWGFSSSLLSNLFQYYATAVKICIDCRTLD